MKPEPTRVPVQDGVESTVLKMLALSEGLMPYAAKEAYIYRREGQRQQERNSDSAEQDHGAQSPGRAAAGQRHPLRAG